MKTTTLFFIALAYILTFTNCSEKIIPTTEIITVRDTIYIPQNNVLSKNIKQDATTFILVRHAEKNKGDGNVKLSPAGIERAAELVRIFQDLPIDAVYSSNFNRTKMTAMPTATDHGLLVQQYDHKDLAGTADLILEKHRGETVLVVGHSTTTPAFVNVLTDTKDLPKLSEAEYDHLFMVTVFEKGDARVVHLRFGELSN